MAGENGQIEIIKLQEDDRVWLYCYVNGDDIQIHILTSNFDGNLQTKIEALAREIYKRAYRKGFEDCQFAIRENLGLT